jgi:hypothetical protein
MENFEDALKIEKGQFFWHNSQTGSKYIMVAEYPIVNIGISVEFMAIVIDPLDQLVVQNKYVFVASCMYYSARLGDQPLYMDLRKTELYKSDDLKEQLLSQIGTFEFLK